jgi:hypothetical protein
MADSVAKPVLLLNTINPNSKTKKCDPILPYYLRRVLKKKRKEEEEKM